MDEKYPNLPKIVDYIYHVISILSVNCLDKAWCSVIVNGTESAICTQTKAKDDCPVKCNSYLPKEHPCYTPGTNCNVEYR